MLPEELTGKGKMGMKVDSTFCIERPVISEIHLPLLFQVNCKNSD
jgi:hypothetical protein